jgi:hypothetical protein
MSWMIAYVIIGLLFSSYFNYNFGIPSPNKVREKEPLVKYLGFLLVMIGQLLFVAALWPILVVCFSFMFLKENYEEMFNKYRD